MKPNISIIMPAHNEEKRIGKTLEEYSRFFKNLKKEKKIKDFEILVVLNACKDGTIDVVKKFQKKNKKIKYLNFEKAGKGFAIIEGFKEALKKDFDLIGFVDADMATSPEAFYELVKNIGNYDGIIASRWCKKAIAERSTGKFIRSKGFNFLTRILFLFPYKDTQCGAKLFKKNAIKKILPCLTITKWAFDVCLLYWMKKNKLCVKESPTIWKDKEGSKIKSFRRSIKISIQMAAAILRLRLINSPFKKIIKLYDYLPEKIKIHH